MSESTETVNPETVPAVKVSVADRKALAASAFVVGADATEVAALFGNVPNGREFVDVTYSTLVTATTLAAVAAGDAATIGEQLAPIAELRESVLSAMTLAGVTTKTERVVDPAEKRAALVARIGELTAIAVHLSESSQWVHDLLTEIDPADLTEDELLVIADATNTVPEKVSTLTTRLATIIEKTPKGASDGSNTRSTQDHSADAAKLVIGYVLVAKGDPTKTATVVGAVNEKGRGDGAFEVNGEKVDSISTAASRLAGGERNGWTYFAL